MTAGARGRIQQSLGTVPWLKLQATCPCQGICIVIGWEVIIDTLEDESTVTKRGQTTIPSAIRKVLKVTKDDDRIVYRVQRDGSVIISKKQGPEDPIVAEFLEFIANDTRNNFSSLRPVTPEWLSGVLKLVNGVEIDLDATLSADDE